jgi:hypothetical protein
LENAQHSAEEIIPKLDGANIEQRYFADALQVYSKQCALDLPNPRILERKGSLIRYVFESEEIDHSVNRFLIEEISQFLEIHNELMRGFFGRTLAEARKIRSDQVEDSVASDGPRLLQEARATVEQHLRSSSNLSGQIDTEVSAILGDLHDEVEELAKSYNQTNDPSLKEARLRRVKVAVMHSALFIGRLVFRSTSAVLEHGAHAATIALFIEASSPGTIKAVYNALRSAIPDLPRLPDI